MLRPTLFAGISAMVIAAAVTAQIYSRDPQWTGYAGNAQHTGMSAQPASALQAVLWSAPIDLQPQFNGSDLLAHYSGPLVTPLGNVIVTVKTGVSGGFEIQGRQGYTGSLIYNQTTDYILPPSGWLPVCGSCLLGNDEVATPGAGGTIYVRTNADSATSKVTQVAFYGLSKYTASQTNKSAFNSNVFVCTPITADSAGNLYFGFRVVGANPAGLTSGVAKVTPTGAGSWISATTATGDAKSFSPVLNCAPAISNDGQTVYIAINGNDNIGWLVGINAGNMTAKYKAEMLDPKSGYPGLLQDIGSGAPMVGPDGDVYCGILENPFYNDRGWMLHYNSNLGTSKTPGSFGWDNTPTVVPADCVPSYMGKSSYLILTKYNEYAGLPGGDGINKVAVLDPNATEFNTQNQFTTMKEVIVVKGITPDPTWDKTYPGAVKEWCINSAAVDPRTKCAIINSEDGHCYRWDFTSNRLSQSVELSNGLGEAYTPTVIGKFGVSYAINNAKLFALGNP